MEVVVPVSQSYFDSTCSSPYISAPSSPQPFSSAYYSYFSAPASPTRRLSVYSEFSDLDGKLSSADNEADAAEDGDYDFAFDFSGHLETASLTAAEDLFDHGKIRPLRPAMNFQSDETPKSPVSSFHSAVSPKQRKETNPFADATENARKGPERERGRERAVAAPGISSSSRRGTRSLSPFRVSEPKTEQSSLKGGSRKWRLKDFLLFRSASEGRATDKDRLRKYSVMPKKEDAKNSSFRSIESTASGSGSRGGRVSAHERFYTANRAVSEEMKRKTFLPYKQGLLGCLGFNPTVQGLAKGFRSITRA